MKTTIYIKNAGFMFIIVLSILSCSKGSSVVRGKSDGGKLRKVEHCKTFNYEIVMVNDKKQGVISIDGQQFPQIFIFVQDKDHAYLFAYDLKKSSVLGYNKTDKIKIKNSDTKITDEELSRGWYLGSNFKVGTPLCWIFVQWNGGSAFISSEGINEIISDEPFNSIFPLSIRNKNLY
ncbi:MAG TPA: hypothetical protein P5123_01260 [Spirochaetota bacterium]|nr:hypothetical protein [Spirochaetota bacterium]